MAPEVIFAVAMGDLRALLHGPSIMWDILWPIMCGQQMCFHHTVKPGIKISSQEEVLVNFCHQALRSECITTVRVDSKAIRADLTTIDQLIPRDTYSEFAFGSWHSYVLANGTGNENDDEFWPQSGPAIRTPIGDVLPAVYKLVEDTFYLDQLRWIRVLTQTDGLLIPHVDFLECDRATTRLQVPLRTTPSSLHSEGEYVVHLRAGEVWFLDATMPHAAYSPPGPSRIALCLDFDVPRKDIAACLRKAVKPLQPPCLMQRPPLQQRELDALIELGIMLDHTTVRDVIRTLGMVHFRRQAHSAASLDWLVAAAERSKDEKLIRRARDFRTYCLVRRTYREHFAW
jgi:putative nonproteinogenic amino acid hydroxylase